MRLKFKYIIIIFIIIIIKNTNVFAATQVVIKEGRGNIIKEGTISTYFELANNLTTVGNTLEGSSAISHMMTNEDWAAVSYFSNSIYGIPGAKAAATTTERGNGISVNMNGTDYYSTNGNETGVMDLGRTTTYMSGILSDGNGTIYNSCTTYGARLIELANTDLVTLVNADGSNFDKLAIKNWFNSTVMISDSKAHNCNFVNPFGLRRGLFSCAYSGAWSNYSPGLCTYDCQGMNPAKGITFRVALWNR